MRELLQNWIETRRTDLAKIGITTGEVHMGPDVPPNPGLYVDHHTSSALGRILIWDSGEMEVEVISTKDGKQLFWKYYQLAGELNFDLLLQNYLNALTGLNS